MPVKLRAYICYVKERMRKFKAEVGESLPGGLQEGFGLFASDWREMSFDDRTPYYQMAKKSSENELGTEEKLIYPINDNGLPKRRGPFMVKPKPLPEILATDKGSSTKIDRLLTTPNSVDHRHQHRSDERYMEDLFLNRKPTNLFFVLINCSYFCRDDSTGFYIPAEIGLTCFSFRKGIVDNYWSLVDPGKLPTGKLLEGKKNQETFKIPLPPFEQRFQNYTRILNNIRLFLERYKIAQDDFTNVYCVSPQGKIVKGCLDWLSVAAGPKSLKLNFRIRSLSTLVQKLDELASIYDPRKRIESIIMKVFRGVNYIPEETKAMTETEAIALIQGSTDWNFREQLCCPYHRTASSFGIPSCCLNVGNRNAMHIMSALIKKFGLTPKVGRHSPGQKPEDDVRRINEFLINWGYIPQFLVYESQEQMQDGFSVDSDEYWFPKVAAAPQHSEYRNEVEYPSKAVGLHLNECETETDVDWDAYFGSLDEDEFRIEIVRDHRKEIMASYGLSHYFW